MASVSFGKKHENSVELVCKTILLIRDANLAFRLIYLISFYLLLAEHKSNTVIRNIKPLEKYEYYSGDSA